MKRHCHQLLALLISSCLTLVGFQPGFAQDAATQSPPQAVRESPEQLQQLVAPIALYPDALVAQILPAATYPEQVVEAAKWVKEHKDLSGEQLASEVDNQPWDPSIKALTQFPAVLANMNQNLAWTSELGDSYLNQQQEVSQAIQTMRERAKQAGNLNSSAQEKVKTKSEKIVIEPAEPDVVYVPVYDPWLVYGYPLAVFPGWYPYPGLFLDGPGIAFGFGFGIGLFAGYGWGWHHWGYDWHHDGRVVYNHNTYISNSRTIVNRNGFSDRGGFNRGQGGQRFGGREGSHGSAQSGEFGGREGFHGSAQSGEFRGTHSGAFSGFDHGGVARENSSRGQSSFGGFHGGGSPGGGFHGGGFSGGGGFHGGGRR